jgi:hypothetical protein
MLRAIGADDKNPALVPLLDRQLDIDIGEIANISTSEKLNEWNAKKPRIANAIKSLLVDYSREDPLFKVVSKTATRSRGKGQRLRGGVLEAADWNQVFEDITDTNDEANANKKNSQYDFLDSDPDPDPDPDLETSDSEGEVIQTATSARACARKNSLDEEENVRATRKRVI